MESWVFSALLLLCGDISRNPGPAHEYLCGICAEEVHSDDAAVCCDTCNKWVHISCDVLSTEDYNDMAQNPTANPWFCKVCSGSEMQNTDRIE